MIDVRHFCMYLTSAKSCLSQIIYFVQLLLAIYSTSNVDNAMVGFPLDFHEMIPTPTKNTCCHGPLHEVCLQHDGHKGDLGMIPGTCGAIGERAQIPPR